MAAALPHIGAPIKAGLYVTWTTTRPKGNGRTGPFDGNDEAAQALLNVLRAHRFGTVVAWITPHVDTEAG